MADVLAYRANAIFGTNLIVKDSYGEELNYKGAQSFVVTANAELEYVNLYLRRNFTAAGSPQAGNITLQIVQGTPTGTVLSTSLVDRTIIPENSSAVITFTFTPFSISTGITYYMVLSCNVGFEDFSIPGGLGQDLILWHYGLHAYSGGNRWYKNDDIDWSDSITTDYCFGVYGTFDAEASKATNPTPAHEATEVDFSDRTLSWENGGGATSYDVYMGDASDNLTLISGGQTETSYVATEANIALFAGGLCYWRVDSVNEAGTTTGDVWNFDARPVKPINPAPETEEKNVEKTTANLTWEDGGGDTDTFNIYFGTTSGALTELETGIPLGTPTWTAPMVVLEIKDYNPEASSGYRSPVAGDALSSGTTTYTLSKVERGNMVNARYEAKLFAFRTGTPVSAGTVITNGVSPDPENPQAVAVTLNDEWYFTGEAESAYYESGTRYYWRVDAVNEAGTTTGDEWYFDTPISWKNERYNFYEPDSNWLYTGGSYQWAELHTSGGGRYKQQLVIVGHNCIYFG